MSSCVYTGVSLQHTCHWYLITDVLYVPRIAHPDNPSHPHLRSISQDELASRFCELLMSWSDTLNFTTHDFAKGPRIFNMMMTFVLTPRSLYNTITEPRDCFFYSLLEGFFIDFPSHKIVSMIDTYWDTATHDKLIFPSVVTRILTYMHVPIPFAPLFLIIGAISQESMWRSATQLVAKGKWALSGVYSRQSRARCFPSCWGYCLCLTTLFFIYSILFF